MVFPNVPVIWLLKLNAPLAIIEKRRVGNADITETLNIIGDVKGMRALTMDDEIDTAGSLVNAATCPAGQWSH